MRKFAECALYAVRYWHLLLILITQITAQRNMTEKPFQRTPQKLRPACY